MKLLIKKLASYAIDYVLVAGLGGLYAFCASVFYLEPATQNKAILMLVCALITVVLLTCYVPTKNNGQTIGQRLMHLRVVNKNGKPRTWWQSVLRECILKVSCAPLFVLFSVVYYVVYLLIMQRNPKGELAHDLLLKTSVVEV